MSEPLHPPPSDGNESLPWKALLVSVAGILIFVGILAIAYVPNNDRLVQAQLEENRAQAIRQKGKELDVDRQSYGWINEQEGVVRIPVERAMQLMVERTATTEEP